MSDVVHASEKDVSKDENRLEIKQESRSSKRENFIERAYQTSFVATDDDGQPGSIFDDWGKWLHDKWDTQFTIFTSVKAELIIMNNELTRVKDKVDAVNRNLTTMISQLTYLTEIRNYLDKIAAFIGSENHGSGLNHQIRRLFSSSESVRYSVDSFRTYMSETFYVNLNRTLNLINSTLLDITTKISNLETIIGTESHTKGLNYQIRLLLSKMSAIYSNTSFLENQIGHDNSSQGLNFQVRSIKSYVNSSLQITNKIFDQIGHDSSTFGLNYQIRRMISKLDTLLTNSNTLNNLIGFDSSNFGLNYQFRELAKKMSSVSAFDYDKFFKRYEDILKNALKNLEFKNESGTNIWDVLKSLVDGLTSLGKEIIKSTADIIKVIGDLVIEIFDRLITLLVPKNLDFLDTSFTDLSDKFKFKFKFIFDFTSVFRDLFSTNSSFKDFEMNINSFNFNARVTLPFSKLNDTLVHVKPIVTAFFLLGFLIDMYKWFYTKGEVIDG